jgi:serine/threonine protein kinase
VGLQVTRSSIGKFQILGHLGRGGMAELYVCRLQGIGGFAKEVVVKRIVPERAGDPYFVRMFLDEARVVASLSHPNIVQVFEVGEDAGVPYLVMEYVKGVTLGMIIRESHRQKKIHFGHAARIVCAICEALDYAHNALNSDGETLDLVHRDVTPGNIVISREGIPKLLDFGVAKAKGRLSHTEAGTIKGKIRYMAPEQVSQGPLDARADVFSLGVCLFELTTGQNPFGPRGGSDVAILKNIINGVFTKPSELVRGFSPALEQIILSAIHQDVHQRCASPRELRDQLEAFVASDPQYASTTRELADWVREMIPGEMAITHTGRLSALRATPTGSPPPLPSEVDTSPLLPSPLREPDEWESAGGLSSGAPVDGMKARLNPMVLRWGLVVLLILGAVGAGAGIWFIVLRAQPPGRVATVPASPERRLPSDDDAAKAYLDAADKLAEQKRFEPARDMVSKAGELKIRDPALNIRLAQLRDTVTTGAMLRAAGVHLQQKDYRAASDVAKAVLDRAPGNPEALAIIGSVRKLSQPPREELSKGKSLALNKERTRTGALIINTTPSAMVYVDDEPIGRSPIKTYSIPAGRHTIQARAHGFAPRQQSVKVSAGQSITVALALTPDGSGSAARSNGHDAGESPLPTLAVRTDRPRAAEEAREEEAPHPAAATAVPDTPAARPAPPPASAVPATPTPGSLGTPKAAPRAVGPSTPGGSDATGSSTRKSVPKPTLPRSVQAADADQVARTCAAVESSVVSVAGISADFARGITGPLRRIMGSNAEIYPVAMYYFIVRESALNHDKSTAAANLAAAYSNGSLLKFKNLPAIERDL